MTQTRSLRSAAAGTPSSRKARKNAPGEKIASSKGKCPTLLEPQATVLLAAPRQTGAALLRARLADPDGVSLAALIEATGWQAHTLRAALSGLRKSGLTIARRREGNDTIYRVVERDDAASDGAERQPPVADGSIKGEA